MMKTADSTIAMSLDSLVRYPPKGSHVVEERGKVLGALVIRGLEMRFYGSAKEAKLVAAVLNWLETHKT